MKGLHIHNIEEVWITKNGTAVPIVKMSDDHLTNTINYLVRTAPQAKLSMELNPPQFQGEQAQYAGDDLHRKLLDMDELEFLEEFIPQWDNLLLEARKRNLPIIRMFQDYEP